MTTGAAIAGKYQLLRPLGKGSMGEVWAAMHLGLGREVALKLIYEGSPELATRLKREAQACGRLEHPNIVRVYDYGETDQGDPFLVMELLNGETLADRLDERPRLPVPEAVDITINVARALGAAHDAGVVHRDLKPANVFLSKNAQGETVKVLDFGVSKILSVDDMSVTTTGALVGSPAYMSPEQARALREIDPRADLWSVGVLLFEMLTGTRPFPSPTVVGVVADILAGPIPTLSSVMPGVDPRLDLAVRRCLTRELDRRMPSAAALIEMLTPVLAMASAKGYETASIDVRLDPNDPDEASTIAMPPRGHIADDDTDGEKETNVLRGPAGAAMRAVARAALANRAPTAPPRPQVQVVNMPPPQPAFAHVPRAPHDSSEDMPTVVHGNVRARRQPPPPPPPMDGGDTTVPTRVIAHPFGPVTMGPQGAPNPGAPRAPGSMGPQGAPNPGAPRAPSPPPSQPAAGSAWDFNPQRQQQQAPMAPMQHAPIPGPGVFPGPVDMNGPVPSGAPRHPSQTWPTQPPDFTDPARLTLPPGWGSAQSDARRVLWITAIAGLVVGLAVFVGLSLLR